MIAGGATAPIHFTNILFDDRLYTLTYRWPDTVQPPPEPADLVGVSQKPLNELEPGAGVEPATY